MSSYLHVILMWILFQVFSFQHGEKIFIHSYPAHHLLLLFNMVIIWSDQYFKNIIKLDYWIIFLRKIFCNYTNSTLSGQNSFYYKQNLLIENVIVWRVSWILLLTYVNKIHSTYLLLYFFLVKQNENKLNNNIFLKHNFIFEFKPLIFIQNIWERSLKSEYSKNNLKC